MIFDLDIFKKELKLDKCLFICCQHIVETTLDLFKHFFKKGLPPCHLHLLGKCYSTNPKTFIKFQKLGVQVSTLSSKFNYNESYDDLYTKNINKFLENIEKIYSLEDFEKIIVMDDGGKLIEAINKAKIPHEKVFAVEQTSSGYNLLKNSHLNFPVVNAARSTTKLKLETPLLLELIKNILQNKLIATIEQNDKVLILGNGVIGKMCLQLLQKTSNVAVLDKNQFKTSRDLRKFLKENLGFFDVILGCTGYTSIDKNLHRYLKPGVKLVSLSSSDREFDAVHLRKQLQQKSPSKSNKKIHQDIHNKQFNLLNSGFPLPFNGNYKLIDKKDFLLTRAVLAAGIYQIFFKKLKKGFNKFDLKYDNKLSNYWKMNFNKKKTFNLLCSNNL